MRLPTAPLLFALALMFMVPGGAGARAEPMPGAVIAVLNYAHILQNSDAAKDIRRQVKQYRDKFRNAVRVEEQRLRDLEAELKRQRGDRGPEAEENRQKFKNQMIAAQRQGQNFKRKLDKSLKSATTKVQRAVILIVQALTVEKGYTIVVDNSQVLLSERALDITKEVMDRLNKTLRTVTVPTPQ
jgi:outer membrane protein